MVQGAVRNGRNSILRTGRADWWAGQNAPESIRRGDGFIGVGFIAIGAEK
jgi:hypothetical protein